MGNKCRVLFVDDDARMLSGIRRLLTLQTDWEIFFAENGPEALELLNRNPLDIVISDMRMKGMDGAVLLDKIRHSYPDIVRIILSGQTSQQKLIEAIDRIHYYIPKPYDLGHLTDSIDTIHQMRNSLKNPEYRHMVANQTALPVVPSVYHKLLEQINSDHPDKQCLSQILRSDIGLLCGLLHIAGAGFSIQAAESAGLSSILARYDIGFLRELVQQGSIFKPMEGNSIFIEYLNQINRHSVRITSLAVSLARIDGLSPSQLRLLELFTTLHDVGKLILLDNRPEELRTILAPLTVAGHVGRQAETEQFGISHSELGAYLLSIWGFPRKIVESVYWHHSPQILRDSLPVRYLAIAETMLAATSDADSLLKKIGQHVSPEKLAQWMQLYQQWSHKEQEQDHAIFSYVSR